MHIRDTIKVSGSLNLYKVIFLLCNKHGTRVFLQMLRYVKFTIAKIFLSSKNFY